MAQELALLSQDIRKEIALLVNRRGQIVSVIVGDSEKVRLPEIKKREAMTRLCGFRCIHTHPRGGGLSKADLTALARLRLDLMVALEALDGKPGKVHLGHLKAREEEDTLPWAVREPLSIFRLEEEDCEELIETIEDELAEEIGYEAGEGKERAVLVSVETTNEKGLTSEESIKELAELVDTAGGEVAAILTQRREKPDSKYYIGHGKVEELALLCQEERASTAIFDTELSPSQQTHLEATLGVKVVDRTALILDIFAQRARTKEGKLQVELAQLNYMLPRLLGEGKLMSRLGGGIGTRGPGETKLEVDRRRIREKISFLEKQVEEVRSHRESLRKSRRKQEMITGALVGYTNAGKSTLLNSLTGAGVLAEDKLFATLDPTVKRFILPSKEPLLISDTVGFIQKLPHHLVKAFKATLEEVTESDFLIHVVDLSNPAMEDQIRTVNQILSDLHAQEKPTVTVFNKMDRVPSLAHGYLESLSRKYPNAVFISALKKEGFSQLLTKIQEFLPEKIDHPSPLP